MLFRNKVTLEKPRQFTLRTVVLSIIAVGLACRIASKRYEITCYKTMMDHAHFSYTPRSLAPQPKWREWLFGDDAFHYAGCIYADEYKITDKALSLLAELKELKTLGLRNTNIRGTGLAFLSDLPLLEHLDLSGTPITDNGLSYIGELTRLRDLELSGTGITNDGLGNLTKLSHLKSLTLAETKINDAGLSHLRVLLDLEYLDLTATDITANGVDDLRKHIPKCIIFNSLGSD